MTANSITNRHPQYNDAQVDWTLMADCYSGERTVKNKNTLYLPATPGQVLDGQGKGALQQGEIAYQAYKKRARFGNFVREAVQMAVGMMHSQPPRIELPDAMRGIRSSKGETLEDLLRRINVEQLISGRIGVMADLPTNPQPGQDLPYLTTYRGSDIINWDDGTAEGNIPQALNLVVLDESENERVDTFTWEKKTKFRVLVLGDPKENEQAATYRQGVFEEDNYDSSGLRTPRWRGNTLQKLPFQIINACDLVSDVDEPPLLDLANICMTIYRMSADYHQNLYMQAQDTFVTIGGNFDEDESLRTGAGARIDLPQGGDAKFVGVESSGLSEQREALDRLERRAGSMGAQTLDTTSRERESGDSLRIRVAARTADMYQIVEAGAEGMQTVLRTVAEWMGENPDEVLVEPNKEFGDQELTGQSMVEMATARNQGFPLSAETMHTIAKARRLTKKTFEEEVAQAKVEEGEDFPFKKAENGDRNPDQIQPAQDGPSGE